MSTEAAKPTEPIDVKQGSMIFNAGEKGGDLYFIEQGEVEIIKDQGGQLITLSVMKPGEVIGVMTCLTDAPRMASARAKTNVKLKHIPHANIKALIAKLPSWMIIVLKEFSMRLQQMNQSYGEASVKIRELEDKQISYVYTATQMVGAIPVIANYIMRKVHDESFLVMEDVFNMLEQILGRSKDDLDKIINVLMSAGLAKIEIQQDTKSIIMKQSSFPTLKGFHQFLLDARGAKGRKLNSMNFSNKETRMALAVAKLARSLYADSPKPVEVGFDTLLDSLEKKTGVAFDAEALRAVAEQKIFKVMGSGENGKVQLVPQQVESMIRHIEAYRKLRAMDGHNSEQAAPAKAS